MGAHVALITFFAILTLIPTEVYALPTVIRPIQHHDTNNLPAITFPRLTKRGSCIFNLACPSEVIAANKPWTHGAWPTTPEENMATTPLHHANGRPASDLYAAAPAAPAAPVGIPPPSIAGNGPGRVAPAGIVSEVNGVEGVPEEPGIPLGRGSPHPGLPTGGLDPYAKQPYRVDLPATSVTESLNGGGMEGRIPAGADGSMGASGGWMEVMPVPVAEMGGPAGYTRTGAGP